MLRKIIIIALSMYLIYILSQSFFKLFDLGADVVSRNKQWAKVLSIETIKRKRSYKYGGGHSVSWHLTVNVKNKTPLVNLTVGPPPKVGGCVPIIVNELSNGKIIASIDNQEWRYGTTNGSCV